MLKKWEDLPECMRTDEVRPYYEVLRKKRICLVLKRGFDLIVALQMVILLLPVFAIISIVVSADSRGGILFKQERITQYGRKFYIFKFRTMKVSKGRQEPKVTVLNDSRVTKSGRILRKYRLDELPQLINIIKGDMSFVGSRPEVPYFVKTYTPEMLATLLLPAGVTSEASICYKDEQCLLDAADDMDAVYVQQILPGKMAYNLNSIRQFSLIGEMGTMVKTILAVVG